MPFAEKPARRWKRIAATRRRARRSFIDSRGSSSSPLEVPSSAAAPANGRRRERLRALLHLEVHADLEQAQGRQLAHRLSSGQALEHVERAVEAEPRAGLGRDREPEVEVVVAQVVVRDARVRVDDLGGTPRVLGIDLCRDEHGAIAEHARVEDRRDLADDALLHQTGGSDQNLLHRHAGELRHVSEGPRRDREAALEQVEELSVQLVERDRGPVLSAPNLGYRLSHRATSFAWEVNTMSASARGKATGP